MLNLKWIFVAILFWTTCCTSTVYNTVNKILFLSTSPLGGWELFSINSDGTDVLQLTKLKNLIGNICWSSDGQHVAFTTFPPGLGLNLTVNIMNPDGSGLRQLTSNATGGITWSPNSAQIAFLSKRDGLGEIYLINPDGSGEKRLTYGSTDEYMNDVYSLSWSSDNKQIAFIRLYKLYMINADGSNERPLSLGNYAITTVAWSPNMSLIAFVMTVKQQPSIYTMRPDGTDIKKVIDIPSDYTLIKWLPDRQHLTYTQKNDGRVSLFVVDADGQNNLRLADNTVGASWSPDSKRFVYSTSDANLKSIMFVVDLDGKNLRRLSGNNFFDNSPNWSPMQ